MTLSADYSFGALWFVECFGSSQSHATLLSGLYSCASGLKLVSHSDRGCPCPTGLPSVRPSLGHSTASCSRLCCRQVTSSSCRCQFATLCWSNGEPELRPALNPSTIGACTTAPGWGIVLCCYLSLSFCWIYLQRTILGNRRFSNGLAASYMAVFSFSRNVHYWNYYNAKIVLDDL